MKKTLGIYLMIAGFLMSFYLIFNVYMPAQMMANVPLPAQPQAIQVPAQPSMPQVATVNAEQTVPDVPSGEPLSMDLRKEDVPAEPLVVAKAPVAAVPEPLPLVAPKDTDPSPKIVEPTVERGSKYERPHKNVKRGSSPFEVPNGLKTEVDFWIKIYSKYTNDQAVLHDPDDLGNVYGVIKLPHCDDPPRKECLQSREDVIQNAKDEMMEKLGSKAPERIRAQVGQKDKFEAGISASVKYLQQIEHVFDELGVPKELSRLPFVESMFNTKAYSKSKAAGIWQLMPATAKIFGLKVGRGNDERYDPVKATYVAARHLSRDYKRLGAWPLAVNAYNSGPGRLADAVRQLGTKDIVKIIKRYDNPSYGFAARNFYPCFLAALNVYENRDRYFGTGPDVANESVNDLTYGDKDED